MKADRCLTEVCPSSPCPGRKASEILSLQARRALTVKANETFCTNLIEDFVVRIWERYCLLEDLSNPLQLLAFAPVVKGACHVDLFGIVGPASVEGPSISMSSQ